MEDASGGDLMVTYVSSSIFFFYSEKRNINLEAMMGSQEASNPTFS